MKTKMSILLLFSIFALVLSGCGKERLGTNDRDLTRNAPAPTIHTVASDFSGVVVVRLKHGTDLLDGLKKAVEREGIKNAVILNGIGSLTSYHVHAVDNTTFPTKNVFYKAEGPQDLLGVTGYVIDGRVHAHITFSDDEKALGGHLEPGTKAFTFAIITLGILEEGADLARFDDHRW